MTRTTGLFAACSLLVACNADELPLSQDLSVAAPDLATAVADLAQPAVCVGPLSDYCAVQTCRDYDMEVAFQRARAGHPGCFLSRVGTCADFRFVEYSNGGLGDLQIRYYDPGGALIAAHVETDTNAFCNQTSFAEDYGPPIACTRVVTETICACGTLVVPDGGC